MCDWQNVTLLKALPIGTGPCLPIDVANTTLSAHLMDGVPGTTVLGPFNHGPPVTSCRNVTAHKSLSCLSIQVESAGPTCCWK